MYRTTQLQSLTDVTVKDEAKLKAAQDLSDNLDMAIASAEYPRFLEIAMKVFVKILQVCLLYRILYQDMCVVLHKFVAFFNASVMRAALAEGQTFIERAIWLAYR